MAHKAGCPRCRKLLDAPTWSKFLEQAGQMWRAEHPTLKKERGRPTIPNHPLDQAIATLIQGRKATLDKEQFQQWLAGPAVGEIVSSIEQRDLLTSEMQPYDRSTILNHARRAVFLHKSIRTTDYDKDWDFMEKRYKRQVDRIKAGRSALGRRLKLLLEKLLVMRARKPRTKQEQDEYRVAVNQVKQDILNVNAWIERAKTRGQN